MSEEKQEHKERGRLLESWDRFWNQTLKGQLERTVEDTVRRLRIPKREEVQELQRRVAALAKRVDALRERR